jgi:hypothetical protein
MSASMMMSKRERYIGIATVVVVGILVLDRLIVTPLLDSKVDLDAQLVKARDDRDAANRLLSTSRRMDRDWRAMAGTRGERLKDNEAAAESQVLNSIGAWSQSSGLSVSAVKRVRTEKEKDFIKIAYRATATGTMRQVGEFLWKIQTSDIPVRITDIQMNSRKDGTDDLSVQIGIATIYLPPPDTNSGGGGGGGRTASASAAELYR